MISGRDARAIQRGLLVIGIGWLLLHAPAAFDRVTSAFSTLNARRALIARTRADIAQRARYAQSLAALQRSVDSAVTLVLPDTLAADAGRSLLDSVQVILDAHEVRVEEVSEISDTTQHRIVARTSARCVFESDLDEIIATLRELDGDGVTSLLSLRITAPERAEQEPSTEVLRVEATVAAWYRRTSVRASRRRPT
jgi:hypothetical protein